MPPYFLVGAPNSVAAAALWRVGAQGGARHGEPVGGRTFARTFAPFSLSTHAHLGRAAAPVIVRSCRGTALIEKGGVEPTESQDSNLIIGISSDRGLCGGIHSAIAKRVRAKQLETGIDYKLAMLGDKARGIMARTHQDNFVFTASNMGKKTPTFSEAVMLSNVSPPQCHLCVRARAPKWWWA